MNTFSPLSTFFWLRGNLSGWTIQPWLMNLSIYRDCEAIAACAPCQRAVSLLLFNFYWCLTMLAAVQSLNPTLKLAISTRGKWIRAWITLLKTFWDKCSFRVAGSIFWIPLPEQFWVAGCSNGWSLFAVLSCIWHTHKTSSVCLSRHETLLG